jgi:tRNA uridine 5-carbamoylmethylation protein Kti12
MKPILIAMVGLPRSGKSTISRHLQDIYLAPVVNRDVIRLAVHGQRYSAPAEPLVKAISLYMIKALFMTGEPYLIYDETNYSLAARDSIKSPDWQTLFYHVPTSPEVCIERAYATGQPDLEPVIKQMAARYEPLGEDEEVYETD